MAITDEFGALVLTLREQIMHTLHRLTCEETVNHSASELTSSAVNNMTVRDWRGEGLCIHVSISWRADLDYSLTACVWPGDRGTPNYSG